MNITPPTPAPADAAPFPLGGVELSVLDAGVDAQQLVLFLPIATAVVLAARLIVGLRTVGTFAPALLGLAILQLGWSVDGEVRS